MSSKTIKALIFDLDDTLYLEEEFFRSGFESVASVLESRGVGEARALSDVLVTIHLSEGRDRVLNKAADRLGFPEEWIPELVDVFRSHAPSIRLAPDVVPVLERLRRHYKLGCITDGWAEVQRRKLAALGIEQFLDAIVVADDYGRANWKPSALPFETCCRSLGVPPGEALYVGDNPERDVRGACNAGIVCVRIRREGAYFCHLHSSQDIADFEISTFSELEAVLDQLRSGRQVRLDG